MSREVLHKDLQVSVKQCIQTVTIQRKSNTTKTGKLSQKNQTQTEWQYNTGLRGTITRNDFSWFITTNRPFHHKIILFLAAVVYFGSAHKQLWALRAQMKNKGCRKSTVINYYSLFFPSHIWIFLLWCPENSEGELWFMQTHSTVLHLCSPMSRLSSPNEMLAERSVFWYTGSCLISLVLSCFITDLEVFSFEAYQCKKLQMEKPLQQQQLVTIKTQSNDFTVTHI